MARTKTRRAAKPAARGGSRTTKRAAAKRTAAKRTAARRAAPKRAAARRTAAKRAAPERTAAKRARSAELKTRPTAASVEAFLAAVKDEGRRRDARTLLELMRRITGEPPSMWGPSIVGFGRYHYRYESGREGDMPVAGFSPRAQALTLYVMGGLSSHTELLARLGPHTHGKGCLYVKRLADVDLAVLERLIRAGIERVRTLYPEG